MTLVKSSLIPMACFEENKLCSWRELLQAFWYKKPINDPFLKRLIFTGSGKAAIKIILDYFKNKGILKNKNSQILVPQWLGYWVYNTIHKVGFPCLTYNKKVRVILVYHQYGFPQNMDEIMDFAKRKKLVVIEDCAHAYESFYKRKRLGTLGLASIFSLSKMFATFMGGAILTKDHNLSQYISKRLKQDDRFISTFSLLAKILATKVSKKFTKFVEMSYPVYDKNTRINRIILNLLLNELAKRVMEKRRKNYLFLLDYFKNFDFFQNLEKDATPSVVPLITDEATLKKVNKVLNRAGIKTGIYHFDINRNLLNPSFKKCLWVPVHQGLTLEDMDKICNLIREALN